MYHHKGNAKPAGIRSAYFFPKAGYMTARTLLQGVQKPQKYVPKISEKPQSKIRHFAMPLLGDEAEKFNIDAPTGTILVYGDCDFSHFFDMAAHLNPISTSCYHSIVGLTNLTPVIQTQTFDQYK